MTDGLTATENVSPATRLAPAIADAIAQEMRVDSRVFVMGEDVTIGVMGPTRGLSAEFGTDRVRDTPIAEAAILGAAIGAAIAGLRPVVDLMFSGFTYVAYDQLVNQAARLRYMTGGQLSVPIVVIAASGASGSNAAQHSESPYPSFLNAGGLRVAFPSTVHQAFWLTRAAIRSEDPVVLLHHPALSAQRGKVGEQPTRLGDADVTSHGRHLTIVAVGLMAHRARVAAHALANEGILAEVVDLCSLSPLPWDTIFESVEKTGRLLIVDESRLTCSVASEVAATVAEQRFHSLRAPLTRLCVRDVPIPFAPNLEEEVKPSEDGIRAAARKLLDA